MRDISRRHLQLAEMSNIHFADSISIIHNNFYEPLIFLRARTTKGECKCKRNHTHG